MRGWVVVCLGLEVAAGGGCPCRGECCGDAQCLPPWDTGTASDTGASDTGTNDTSASDTSTTDTSATDTSAADTADTAGCDVVLTVTVDGARSATVLAGDTVTLDANVKNVTDHAVTLALIDQCPSGEAQFDGLGSGYDYYDACMSGACQTTGETITQAIGAGATWTVETAVDLGAGSCNGPVAVGAYSLGATLPMTSDPQPVICATGPARLEVQ